MKSFLNADSKELVKTIGPLLLIVLLLISVVGMGFRKVSEIRIKVKDAQADILALNQKLNVLSEVGSETLALSNISNVALPSENPSLMTSTQLKSLAGQYGLTLANLKSGSDTIDTTGLKKVEISFDIESSKDLIFQFLSGVKGIAPLSFIEKVKINEASGFSRASVVVKTYYAELPVSLPPLTQAFNGLSKDEEATLNRLSTLSQPSFVEIPSSNTVSTRLDPFNF